MNLDLNGFNNSIANSASLVADIQRQQEETWRSLAQANQERIEKEKVLKIYERNRGQKAFGNFDDFAASFEKVLAAEAEHPPTQLCTRWNIDRITKQVQAE